MPRALLPCANLHTLRLPPHCSVVADAGTLKQLAQRPRKTVGHECSIDATTLNGKIHSGGVAGPNQ